MTECCLLACCRPRTHARLVADLYPRGSTGFERTLVPNKLNRLCSYAASYPRKIEMICSLLENDISNHLRYDKIGYVNIGVASFHKLVDIALERHIAFTIEPYLRRLLLLCFSCAHSSVLASAAGVFFTYTTRFDRCDVSPFIRSILEVCLRGAAPQRSSAEEQSVGLELLLRVIEVLSAHAGTLEKYCPDIVSIVYHYFSTQKVYFVDVPPSDNPEGLLQKAASVVHLRSPATLSTLCLIALGASSSPHTLVHVVSAVFVKLDETLWEARASAVKAFTLLHTSANTVNSFSFPVCSMILAHARHVLDNHIEWNTLSVPFDFEAVLADRVYLNQLGSEDSLRAIPVRAQVINNMLDVICQIYEAFAVPHEKLKVGGVDVLFNRMLCSSDISHLLEIIVFSASHTTHRDPPECDLPPSVVIGIDLCTIPDQQMPEGENEVLSSLFRNISKQCMKVLQHVVAQCLPLIELPRTISQPRKAISAPCVAAFRFLRAMSDKFLFSGKSLPSSEEPNTVTEGVTLQLLQAVNIILFIHSVGRESNGDGIVASKTDRCGPDLTRLLFLCPSVQVSVDRWGYERYIQKADLFLLLSYLEDPNFYCYRIAASAVMHLLDLLFHGQGSQMATVQDPGTEGFAEEDLTVSLSLQPHFQQSSLSIHVMLTCLYDSMYRDLIVFDGYFHSERVATNWLIQSKILERLGIKELCYGIPRVLALYRFWGGFVLSKDSLHSEYSFLHSVEFLSCQYLLFSVYLHAISERVDSPDLALIATHLQQECIRVFPRFISSKDQFSLPARQRCKQGRRLAVRGSQLWVAQKKDDETLSDSYSDLNLTPQFVQDAIDNISSLLKEEMDLNAISDALTGTLASFFDSFEKPTEPPRSFLSGLEKIFHSNHQLLGAERGSFEPMLAENLSQRIAENFDIINSFPYVNLNFSSARVCTLRNSCPAHLIYNGSRPLLLGSEVQGMLTENSSVGGFSGSDRGHELLNDRTQPRFQSPGLTAETPSNSDWPRKIGNLPSSRNSSHNELLSSVNSPPWRANKVPTSLNTPTLSLKAHAHLASNASISAGSAAWTSVLEAFGATSPATSNSLFEAPPSGEMLHGNVGGLVASALEEEDHEEGGLRHLEHCEIVLSAGVGSRRRLVELGP